MTPTYQPRLACQAIGMSLCPSARRDPCTHLDSSCTISARGAISTGASLGKGKRGHQSCPLSLPLLPALPSWNPGLCPLSIQPKLQSQSFLTEHPPSLLCAQCFACALLSPTTTFPLHLALVLGPFCHILLQGSPLPRKSQPQWVPLLTSRPGSPEGPVRPGGPTGPGGPRSPDAPGAPCLPGSPWGQQQGGKCSSEALLSLSGEGADQGSVLSMEQVAARSLAPRTLGEEPLWEPGWAQLAQRTGHPHSPMGQAGRGILAHHAVQADRRCPVDQPDPGDLEDHQDPERGEERGKHLRDMELSRL